MADEVASLLVRITADGTQAVGVLNGVASTVTTLADKNASLMNKVAATGNLAGSVGRTITKTFGVATVAGLVASAKAAGQLNKELANIGTLSVPTERLQEFKGQIQDVAIATGKSTSDISEGTYQVISAFGDAPDTMEKVEINAKAATAGLATTADSIALTSAVTKAYGDTSAGATQQVADLAFKTVELGQTTFPELAQNMQQVTSLSKELGVSQEELFGAYATLTGVTGNAAEVQTQMKAVYTALLKPSDNMQAAISKLGYSSGFTMIKTLGFAETLKALKSATNGSEEQMLGLFNNVRAMPAVMALTGAQSDVFAEKLEKMKNASGAATKAFEVQTEGIAKTGFTLEQAKVKMQVAAQNFGESAAPIIADFADVVDKVSTKLSSMSDEERKAIINTGMLITKVSVGLSVGDKVLTMGTKIVGTAKTIGPALIAGIATPAGLTTLAVAGVTGAIALSSKAYADYQYNQSHFADGAEKAVSALKKQKSALDEVSKYTSEFKELQIKLNSDDISEAEKNQIITRMQQIAEWFKKNYEVELKVESGSIEVAAENVDKLNDTLNHVKIETDIKANNTLSELMQGYEQFQNAPNDHDWNIEQAKKWEADADRMLSAQMKVEEIASQVRLIKSDALKSEGQKLNELKKYEREYQNILKELYPDGGDDYNNLLAGFSHIDTNNPFEQRYKDFAKQAQEHTANAELAQQQMEKFTKSAKDYIAQQNEMLSADVTEGNDYSERIKRIGYAAQMAELPLSEVAAQTAAAQNGFKTFADAAAQGGIALNNTVMSAVHNMIQWGESTQEAVAAGALMKNGFSDIQTAIEAGKLSEITAQANELAHSMELIPTDKHIVINADGDVSILEDVQSAAAEVMNNADISIQVSANGDVTVLDTVDEKLKELINNNQVTVTFNAQTNGFDISNLQGNKLGEITANGKIQWKNETEDYNPENKEAKVTFKKDSKEVDEYNPPNLDRTVTYHAKGDVPKPNARGTQNFTGGLALVNDDGRADPRELIIDRGRAFIPEGRDVVLPLSRGAKVYTSEQTKAIMSGLGIPRYASGKNNSDAFTSAKDNWTHYTKTHSVTTEQELQKWLEFQEKYKENEKDIWDIEEQVFSLQKKLYSERVSESEKWLKHEEKYNGMSVSDYLAGIERMKAYTAEYYAQGIINHKEYTDAIADLDEKYLDKRKEQLSELYDLSTAYISEHTYFNDWDDNGDDPLSAYNRVMDRNREALANGELTQKEYDDYAKNLGSDMLSQRTEQSMNWLEEQRKYFGMSDAEYVEGLERIKAYTQEYYDKGLISRREYNEAMTDLNHSMWDEALDAYDDMLQKQQDYISEMREQFQKEEQALQDSWAVADRKTDMSEVQAQLDIYSGAVTDRGQQKYKELQEQMKQLQRDEELYNLQVRNNATLEGLEADYKTLEENKKTLLNELRATDMDISDYVDSISTSISNSGANIESLLGELLSAFKGFKVEAPSTTYADNRVVNLSAMPLSEFAANYMGGINL